MEPRDCRRTSRAVPGASIPEKAVKYDKLSNFCFMASRKSSGSPRIFLITENAWLGHAKASVNDDTTS
eukprot:4479402-Alexandrium_andersonii.AAC.1